MDDADADARSLVLGKVADAPVLENASTSEESDSDSLIRTNCLLGLFGVSHAVVQLCEF